jgi:anti-sigma regulatory factor (Ser/Thr protein kinase)
LLRISDSSSTAEARRAGRKIAHSLGFGETGTEKVAIVVTEACTNLLKHAGGGDILLAAGSGGSTVDLHALDRGPGMANARESMRDGYSTAGTAGTGLGAIGRLSDFSDIYSLPGRGAALFASIANNGDHSTEFSLHAIQAAKPGQDVCGDAWGIINHSWGKTIVVADGLGHGPEASAASRLAVEVLERCGDLPPRMILEEIHKSLRVTRGAAVAVAELNEDHRILIFAGLGNVTGLIWAGDSTRHMVSMNGTAGIEGRHIYKEFNYPWHSNSAMIMYSDGLSNRWDPREYPGLAARRPALISGVLFRDLWRGGDDATVVVAK